MSERITRRRFLKSISAGALAAGGLHADAFGWLSEPAWTQLPRLDGSMLFDDAAREQMSVDLGENEHRVPAAVLRPRSARDVVRIVRFANARRLKVAMRGQGHSQYGQTLAEGGIVIDSRTLNGVHVRADETVDAEAGASWNDVTRATLQSGLTPRAMGDTMTLSVGGILNAGGVSNSSHLFGAVVDQVTEADVVTGSGDLLTCSPRSNRELFDLALAGMGQCAFIVRARLRLMAAPKWVVRRDLDYDDLKAFRSDHLRLATAGSVEHLGAYVLPGEKDGRWRFRINIGSFCASPADVDFSKIESGLAFKTQSEPVATSFPDYLQREAARNAAADAARKATPSRGLFIAMFVPASVSEEFIGHILDTAPEMEGVGRFSLYVLPTRRFTRRMFMLPPEDLAVNIWMMRRVPLADEDRYTRSVAMLHGLIEKMRAVSGKAYPPYAPFFTRSDWEAHYGSAQWSRLVEGKRRFDPGSVLTPGMSTGSRLE